MTALKILKTLQKNGFHALYVGGAVRDALMNVEPNDYDIVTNATLDQMKEIFSNVVLVGENFGVCVIDGHEVATFRKDSYHPDMSLKAVELVVDGTLEELITADANRRDFTINAVYYDPIKDMYYDPVGGVQDIQDGNLDFVGDYLERLQEDPARLLRLLRFAMKYPHMKIDDDALYMNTEDFYFFAEKISVERVFKETTKALIEMKTWDVGIFESLLMLLSIVVPETRQYSTTEQSAIWHPEGNLMKHTFGALKQLRVRTPETVWSVLLHDIGKVTCTKFEDGKWTSKGHEAVSEAITRKALKALNCSNSFIDTVCFIVGQHMRIKLVKDMRESKRIRLISHKDYKLLKEVSMADSMSSYGEIDWWEYLNEMEATMPEIIPGEIEKPWITGSHLIELGYQPSPKFKDVLSELHDLQLEDILTADSFHQTLDKHFDKDYPTRDYVAEFWARAGFPLEGVAIAKEC